MIQLITTTEQTLAPGQSITFEQYTQTKNSCCSMGRVTPSSLVLKQNGIYQVSFGANIGGPTAATPVQLSIEVAGSPVSGGTMMSTPAATTDFNSVSRMIPVVNGCGYAVTVTVTNSGANSVIVAPGAVLSVTRIA